jgi:hypothetical protein
MTIKRIRVKIFSPHNRGYQRHLLVLQAGRVFSEEGVDRALEQMAGAVEQLYPQHEYGLVQVFRDSFNFVWRSEKNPVIEMPKPAEAAA